MHTVLLKLCYLSIFLRTPYTQWGNRTIAPVPVKQSWRISMEWTTTNHNIARTVNTFWCTTYIYIYIYTVRCRYNAVNFLLNAHKRHSIARPWRSVVILKSNSHSATVIAVPYVISWRIGPPYNGTRLYNIYIYIYIDDLAQDCSNPGAWAMEFLQSCTKLSILRSISYSNECWFCIFQRK